MPVPVVPPPNSEVVVVVPPVDGAGLVFPKILPPPPNVLGVGVDGFPPNKPPGMVPVAWVVEVAPLPNRPPPVAGVAVVVEPAPKSVPAGLEPKVLAGAVVVVPVPVVPVLVVPVPVAGVVVDVLLV